MDSTTQTLYPSITKGKADKYFIEPEFFDFCLVKHVPDFGMTAPLRPTTHIWLNDVLEGNSPTHYNPNHNLQYIEVSRIWVMAIFTPEGDESHKLYYGIPVTDESLRVGYVKARLGDCEEWFKHETPTGKKLKDHQVLVEFTTTSRLNGDKPFFLFTHEPHVLSDEGKGGEMTPLPIGQDYHVVGYDLYIAPNA